MNEYNVNTVCIASLFRLQLIIPEACMYKATHRNMVVQESLWMYPCTDNQSCNADSMSSLILETSLNHTPKWFSNTRVHGGRGSH